MARRLTAAGYFKRMYGSWLPESDRKLYEKNDKIFVKRTEWPALEQVGGVDAGNAPAESARILFWNGTCRVCDLNLVKVYVRTGMANTGKLVLTMSQDENFQEGWFVAVESVVSQMTIPLLTILDDGKLRARYVDSRRHTRLFGQDPIVEADGYINAAFPSLNVIGVREVEWQDWYYIGTNSYDYINSINGYYGGGPLAANRVLLADSEAQQFTARLHKVTCGTVSSGSRSTISTQAVWTGIYSQTDPPSAEMWLGLGDNFVRAGIGRHVFLPPMQLTHLQRDRLQPLDRFWKVDAIPGDILTVRDQGGSGRSRSTAGIAAIGASGTLVLGTHVTESPKARSMRSSLVTSAQGLIWGDGVLPGMNVDHTAKAIRTPATVFPFDQPQQSRALSIGAAKANPASLNATFVTTPIKRTINWYANMETVVETVPMSHDSLRPIVRVRQGRVIDESGIIGRVVDGWNGQVTDSTNVPTKAPWVGVFDAELELMRNGGSNQTQSWKTIKADKYGIEVEGLYELDYLTWSGMYVGTNVMPDGTQSSPNMFYAAPELPEISSVPTLSEPIVARPDDYSNIYHYHNSIVQAPGYGEHFVQSVFSFSEGIPFLYASKQFIGSWDGGSFFGGEGYWVFNPGTNNTDYRTDGYDYVNGIFTRAIAGWNKASVSHSNTATKLSAQMIFSARRYLSQAIPEGEAPGDATPPSEFHKASTSQFDDYMTRLCAASRITVVKSCRWIPKQTQMFMTINRENWRSQQGGVPGGWGYYGGTVPEEDRLEMLDQYESTGRGQVEPTGGMINVYLRRTWQIELVIASGAATYTPMEVISDELETVIQYADNRRGGHAGAVKTYTGTRTAKCGVEFDVEAAETTTHLMSHEQREGRSFYFTELEWERLEAGESVEKDVEWASTRRFVQSYNNETSTYIDTTTKVVFQFT